jgi:hypothetical protein
VNEILKSLKSDLLDRRMLPIVVLLVAAVAGAVAYTVLAGSGSSNTPAAAAIGPVTPPTRGPTLAVQQAPANPNGAVAETTDGVRYQHKAGKHNPFTPLPGAVKVEVKTTTSTPAASTPSSESKSSSSTGGSSTTPTQPTQPAKPTTPAKKPKPKPAYVVNLQFGALPTTPGAPVELVPYELRARKQLPSVSDPKIIFTGVHGSPFEAVFALTAEVIPKPTSQGTCVPSTSQCESIELAAGKSEQLEYLEPTGQTVVYELKVISIARPEGASAARIARRRHHHHHHG